MSWYLRFLGKDFPVALDRTGKVQSMIDRYGPHTTHVKPWTNLSGAARRYGTDSTFGLPEPNWTPQPPFEVNTVFVPTGASRWTQACVIADLSDADEGDWDWLRQGFEVEVVLSPGDPEYSIPLNTFDLRPLGNNVWLLFLVDRRFFWQSRLVNLTNVNTTTWTNLFQSIAGKIDEFSSFDAWATPATGFAVPDSGTVKQWIYPASLLFDAMAEGVGVRVVWENAYKTVNISDSVTHPAADIVWDWSSSTNVPARQVAVYFRRNFARYLYDARYPLVPPPADYGDISGGNPNLLLPVISTMMAVDESANPSSVINITSASQTKLDDLRDALADGLRARAALGNIDRTYAGVVPLESMHAYDFWEYRLSLTGLPDAMKPDPEGYDRFRPVITTRAKGLPPHYGILFNFSQDDSIDPPPLSKLIEFELTAALTTSDASAAATVVATVNPIFDADSNSSITVLNLDTSGGKLFEGDIGDRGLAYWSKGTEYKILQMECP